MASKISITGYNMGTANIGRNTEETNTDAKENSKGKPVAVATPAKDVVDEHRDSLTMDKDDKREALEEQKLPSEEFIRKESNPTLPKTTIIVGKIYALHQILTSPSPPAPKKRPLEVRKPADSGDRLGVALLLLCWRNGMLHNALS
jgi:hypothetical protein